uniref:Uncharacterized protein n=1 Tax=Anguilla anguilla TaxID=7936 RepID=A0A0E9WV74_ANGAN
MKTSQGKLFCWTLDRTSTNNSTLKDPCQQAVFLFIQINAFPAVLFFVFFFSAKCINVPIRFTINVDSKVNQI